MKLTIDGIDPAAPKAWVVTQLRLRPDLAGDLRKRAAARGDTFNGYVRQVLLEHCQGQARIDAHRVTLQAGDESVPKRFDPIEKG